MKEVLDLVDTMIANKKVIDGKIYYAASDVMAVTDALGALSMQNIRDIQKIVN